MTLSDKELKVIEERARKTADACSSIDCSADCVLKGRGWDEWDLVDVAHVDVPKLIAEVRRLSEEVKVAQIADENAIRNSPLSKAHTQVVLQNDQLVERIKELEQDASILREMLRSDRVGSAILMGIISEDEADESFNKKIKAQIEDELAFRKRSIISQMRKEG